MCDAVKEYAKEQYDEGVKTNSLQTAINLINVGVSDDIIAKSVTFFSLEEIQELRQKLQADSKSAE